MATTFDPPLGGYNYVGWTPTYSSGTTTATTTLVSYPVGSTIQVAPTPKAKKQTPLQWLEAEVERVCAVTRPGLALS